jgi:Mg-chelatase subunit ChlD
MKRALATVTALLLLLAAGFSADADATKQRRPLDLPSGGRGIAHDDGDFPELIHFYAEPFEGEAFFFCLDRSGSMVSQERWTILKQEVGQALRSLSPEAEFGIVAFNESVAVLHEQPERATGLNRQVALAWLDGLTPYGSTCIAPAAIKTLEISRRSAKPRKVLIVVGDGIPACLGNGHMGEVIEEIAIANYEQTPINTVLIGPGEGIAFMQELAETSGGRFVHVSQTDLPPVP